MKEKTLIQHIGEDRSKNNGAVVAPIYQNSLFTFESWEDIDKAFDQPDKSCIYTRGNNPTAILWKKKLLN